jgi:signal transduction histidine kinase
MDGLSFRVSCKRLLMQLQHPSPERYIAALSMAGLLLLACLALDFYSSQTLANSARLGAQFRTLGPAVAVTELDAQGALARNGIRKGDRVLSIAGRAVDAAAFAADPESSLRWSDRDRLYEWQRFLEDASHGGVLPMVFATASGEREILCPVQRMGWREAAMRSWTLRLVGWGFLLPALLIWIKKQSEASLANLAAGLCVFASLSAFSGYMVRDLWLPASALGALSLVRYVFSQSMILTLHSALVFPTQLSWLPRYPWVRVFPWCLLLVQLVLHYGRIYPTPAPGVSLLSLLSLLAFVSTLVLRLWWTNDSLERAQLRWIALGSLVGFLPWVLLSAFPAALHLTEVPVRYTLLSLIVVPITICFAILRYRLLDVDGLFDWVVVHAVALSAFMFFELLSWNWLSAHYAAEAVAKPMLLALSLCVAVFLYAPLRNLSLRGLKKLHGRWRPSLTDSLHRLLSSPQATEDPRAAIEQTMQWALNPDEISWVYADQQFDALLKRLHAAPRGLLGYELGEDCPAPMQSAAWIPVHNQQEPAALVLSPHKAIGWNRHELRLACSLARAGEPLFEMQRLQNDHQKAQAALHEQRDELLREMHDGLGSQLFGASLLSNVPEKMTEAELRKRFGDVNAALGDAMDSLRTGLTVLSTSPGAFGPAVLSLLLRAERVLDAAGIALRTHIDDETMSLQLDSRNVFGVLRAMQEALTNIARHSRATSAQVHLTLREKSLTILIQDDGIGFVRDKARSGHGLANMTRRLQLLNGCTAIASAPNAGCTIELILPLRNGAL